MLKVEELRRDLESRILIFMNSRKRGSTLSFIANRVGSNPNSVVLILNKLLALNIVEKKGKFFRLKGRRRAFLRRLMASPI